MFSMKKPAIILVLIVLLVFTGYLNHNLTKQASSKVSNDYQKHEEMELARGNFLEDSNLVPAISEGDEENDIEILDTREFEDIEEITKNTEQYIKETIVKEDSLSSKIISLSKDYLGTNLEQD